MHPELMEYRECRGYQEADSVLHKAPRHGPACRSRQPSYVTLLPLLLFGANPIITGCEGPP